MTHAAQPPIVHENDPEQRWPGMPDDLLITVQDLWDLAVAYARKVDAASRHGTR